MTYNGHTNWATWNVALWIGNVEGLYLHWKEIGQTLFETAADTLGIGKMQLDFLEADEKDDFDAAVQEASRLATHRLAKELELADGEKFWVDLTDLEGGSDFDSVDWEDVAEGILEEAHFTTDEDMEVQWQFPAKEEDWTEVGEEYVEEAARLLELSKAGEPVSKEWDYTLAEQIGNKLIKLLGLRIKDNGRVDTDVGDKTPVGLALTVKRLIDETEKGEV